MRPVSDKTTRDAAGNKERWEWRHTPTQDPSTDLSSTVAKPLQGVSSETCTSTSISTRDTEVVTAGKYDTACCATL